MEVANDLRPVIINLVKKGLSTEEIVEVLGITKSTLKWMIQDDPEFRKQLEEARDYPNYEVEQALFRRALGYEYYQVEAVNGKPAKVILKHVKPSVPAIMFWLKTRMPERWASNSGRNMTLQDEILLVESVDAGQDNS